MLDRTRLLAGSLVLGSLLLGASTTTPAFAEQQNDFKGGSYDDDHECLTVKQVQKKLKRSGYKDLSYAEQYSKGATFFFSGVKPKRDGTDVVWHLYYDSCERELVGKESQE